MKRDSSMGGSSRMAFLKGLAAGVVLPAFAGVSILPQSGGTSAAEDWREAFRRVGFDPEAPGSSYFIVTSDVHAPAYRTSMSSASMIARAVQRARMRESPDCA